MLPLKLPNGQIKLSGLPRIDYRHALAQGLVFYGFDTGHGKIIDLAQQRKATQLANSTRPGSSPFGQALSWVNNDSIVFTSDAAIENASLSGNFTWACAASRTGTVNASAVPFGRTANNGASQPFMNWGFFWDDSGVTGSGQNTVSCVYDQGGFLARVGNANFTTAGANTFNTLMGVASGGSGANAATVKFYGNGGLVATDTGVTFGNTNTNDATIFSGNSAAAVAAQFFGFVYYGAAWNRALSAAEAVQLHNDPYSFLIFPEDEIVMVGRGNRLFTQAMSPTARASSSINEARFRGPPTTVAAVSGTPSMVTTAAKAQFVSANALSVLAKQFVTARSVSAQTAPSLVKKALRSLAGAVNAVATLTAVKYRAFVNLVASVIGTAPSRTAFSIAFSPAFTGAGIIAGKARFVSAVTATSASLSHPSITKTISGAVRAAASFVSSLLMTIISSSAQFVASLARVLPRSTIGSTGSAAFLPRGINTSMASTAAAAMQLLRGAIRFMTATATGTAQLVRSAASALAGTVRASAQTVKTNLSGLTASSATLTVLARQETMIRLAQARALTTVRLASAVVMSATGKGAAVLARALASGLAGMARIGATMARLPGTSLIGSTPAVALIAKTVASLKKATAIGFGFTVGPQYRATMVGTASAAATVTVRFIKSIAAGVGTLAGIVSSVIYKPTRHITIESESINTPTLDDETLD